MRWIGTISNGSKVRQETPGVMHTLPIVSSRSKWLVETTGGKWPINRLSLIFMHDINLVSATNSTCSLMQTASRTIPPRPVRWILHFPLPNWTKDWVLDCRTASSIPPWSQRSLPTIATFIKMAWLSADRWTWNASNLIRGLTVYSSLFPGAYSKPFSGNVECLSLCDEELVQDTCGAHGVSTHTFIYSFQKRYKSINTRFLTWRMFIKYEFIQLYIVKNIISGGWLSFGFAKSSKIGVDSREFPTIIIPLWH